MFFSVQTTKRDGGKLPETLSKKKGKNGRTWYEKIRSRGGGLPVPLWFDH